MTHPNTTRLSYRLRLLCGLALFLGLCIMLGGLARPAHAQSTLSVTNCSSDTQLQAAVTQASTDNAGDVITFACSGDIKLSSTLTIFGSMTLSGSGQSVTLDGGGSMRVLSVNPGVNLSLDTLTVAHGSVTNGPGSGLNNFYGSTVSISNSTFAYNSAIAGSGLYNNVGGRVSISNSTFANNSATNGPGGGLFNAGDALTISNSAFVNNSATSGNGGGGLYNDGDALTISNSAFVNNSATSGPGGGLSNIFNKGTVSISNSTFANNSSLDGGGLANDQGTVSISNSTFANNSAANGGGGLYTYAGTLSISNSTFANNSATSGPGGGGLLNWFGKLMSISGSIVAGNTGDDCATVGDTITDQGYNLDSDGSCFTASTSLHTNPQLGPLANNGGPTQTMALQSGSPAIDAGPSTCPSTDQRGVSRPDNGESACDIGAYEFVDPVDKDLGLSGLPANITVDATSPQGAVVTYTPPTATDESGDSSTASVSCTPASGSTFAIGTTKVTCTASDSDDTNSPVSGSFQVVVKDVTAPTLSVPSTITVDASSPQGAPVSYTVTATDPDNAPSELKISCSPAAGSTFPIGTSTVHCTAADPSGNNSSGSFSVVVKGAAAQVSDLVNQVNGDHLSSSLQNALDNKLKDTLTAIKAGQTTTACSDLTDFSGYVQSHTGKGITTSQASALIAAAKQVQAVLGC